MNQLYLLYGENIITAQLTVIHIGEETGTLDLGCTFASVK